MSKFHHAPTHDQWPRLSETLPHRDAIGQCFACGEAGDAEQKEGPPTLEIWQEHDWQDKPELRFVVLCPKCSKKLIEPHPRLYAQRMRFTPSPGVMNVCKGCRHAQSGRCNNPKSQSNGGEGLVLTAPKPTRVHLYMRKGSGWYWIYPGPCEACNGKESLE